MHCKFCQKETYHLVIPRLHWIIPRKIECVTCGLTGYFTAEEREYEGDEADDDDSTYGECINDTLDNEGDEI